jgi:transcriptional antiterminator RfaH
MALKIKPKEEKRAEENLLNQGYECYFPALYSNLILKNKLEIKKHSMFPGYAFIKSYPSLELKPVEFTRGVIGVVRFGNDYPILGDTVIQSIRDVEDESIKDPKKASYKIGEFIVVSSGPLKDQPAMITKNISDQRVEILYSLLNRTHTIELSLDNILKK